MKTRNVRRSWTVNTQYKKSWPFCPTNHPNITCLPTREDPGFPRGEARTPKKVPQPIMWAKFPENCMKMKKIGPGHTSKSLQCRSALTKVRQCPCVCHLLLFHPAGTSNDSDKCDFKQRFWHDFTVVVNVKIIFWSIWKKWRNMYQN